MKKITYLLTMIILLLGITPVYASNNIVDFTKKGTITVTLNDEANNSYIEGANIKIYKLADAYSNNHNLDFLYHENLESYQEDIKNDNITNEILDIIYNSDISSYELTTNNLGYVSFNNLDLGLYLVEQTNQVLGYSKIDSFLVYIPQGTENGWTYEVNATPKTDIIRLMDITVEKKWDIADSSTQPKEVTIELLKDGEVIDTVVLNDENNWTYTWYQIEESDTYSVKEKDVPSGYTDTYRQEDNKFIVTNTKTLVQTGQNIILIEILLSFGIILIITGLILNKRNKYE